MLCMLSLQTHRMPETRSSTRTILATVGLVVQPLTGSNNAHQLKGKSDCNGSAVKF